MKRKTILVLAAVFAVLVAIWVLSPKQHFDKHEQPPGDYETTSQPGRPESAQHAVAHPAIPQPRLFKSTRYPPVTPEEKVMWEWWRAMNKVDPKFQWKMPIEFYGKVVDQFGEPVAEATVQFTWTAIDDSHHAEMLSGADGRFQFAGVRGSGLDVSVRKVGYLPTSQSSGGFEYAAFFKDAFHVPDRQNPVVFRLQKLLGSEPVYVFLFEATAKPNGVPLLLDVHDGKLGNIGELSLMVELGPDRTDFGPAYTIRVTGLNGAQLLATTEEFPFSAPEDGYQGSFVLVQPATRESYQPTKNLRFYVRLAGGRYAFVGMEVALLSQGTEVRFSGGVRYNEKWSRNLEFDHRKWINR